MTLNERIKFVAGIEGQLYNYWKDVSINDIIRIKTKSIETDYLHRAAESFLAIKLQPQAIPGFPIDRTMRIMRLDNDSPSISILPIDWVESVDNKLVNDVREWKVKGSKGYYTVDRRGDKYYCNCKGFQFRKKCKHSQLIREQNA